MRTALYVIWFLIPAAFFIMALWSSLEKIGGKKKQEHPGDFLKQGVFVLVCVLISILLDQFVVESLVESLLGDYVPLVFVQIMVLPLVLYLGALAVGPSKDILITRAPHPSQKGGSQASTPTTKGRK